MRKAGYGDLPEERDDLDLDGADGAEDLVGAIDHAEDDNINYESD